MAINQDLPATDSAAALHELIGQDSTATFENDPKFAESNPTGEASSENLQTRADRQDVQAMPSLETKAVKDEDDDDDEYEDVETEDDDDDDEDEDDEDEDDDLDDDDEDEDDLDDEDEDDEDFDDDDEDDEDDDDEDEDA